MLPRFEFLFSRGPPSARSSQIRPHPVTVRHLSVSFLLPLCRSSRATYSPRTENARSPRSPTQHNDFSSIARWRTRVVWPRGGHGPSDAAGDPSCDKYARPSKRVASVSPRTRRSTSLSKGPVLFSSTDGIYIHALLRFRPLRMFRLSFSLSLSRAPCFFFFFLFAPSLFPRPLVHRRSRFTRLSSLLYEILAHTNNSHCTEEKPNSCSRIYLHLSTTLL